MTHLLSAQHFSLRIFDKRKKVIVHDYILNITTEYRVFQVLTT